jgi:hypothetical protein
MKVTSSATARVADEVTREMEQVVTWRLALSASHPLQSVGTDGTISILLPAESLRRNQPANAPGASLPMPPLAQPRPAAVTWS